jgi:hypothetical protein
MPGVTRPQQIVVLAVAIIVVVLVAVLATLPGIDRAFVGVILGAVIAGAVSVGGEWLRITHEAQHDSTKRKDDRWIESNRIQRSVLLRLQGDLEEWTRPVGTRDNEARRQAEKRVERVLDPELRAELKAFLNGDANIPPGADQRPFAIAYGKIHERIGDVLRRYLEPPAD